MSVPGTLDFIERVERETERWQREGLSSAAALGQAWANALLDMEADGYLPRGYLRYRPHDPAEGRAGCAEGGGGAHADAR